MKPIFLAMHFSATQFNKARFDTRDNQIRFVLPSK